MIKRQLTRTLILLLPLLAAQLIPCNTLNAQASSRNYIPSSAMAALIARPADALAQPTMELFPREIVTAMAPKELGFDPCLIKKFTIAFDSVVDPSEPPEFGGVIEFDTPQTFGEKALEGTQADQVGGVKVWRSLYPDQPLLAQLNEKTLAFGSERFLVKMVNAQDAKSELLTLIAKEPQGNHASVFMVMEPVRGLLKQNMPPANQVPPMFRDFLKVPDLVESAVASLDVSENSLMQLRLNATSPEAATELNKILDDAMELGQQYAMMELSKSMRGEDPDLQQATTAYATRVSEYIKRTIKPEMSQDGQTLVFTAQGDASMSVTTIGILTGMLLPAIQQVREAARRTVSKNNLRQLSLAALNYESALQRYPAHAIYSKDGKPLLSWRVELLPYLEEEALYDQFRKDEPWDSEHNIKLLDQMPLAFQNPNVPSTNKTVYQALVGRGTAMEVTQRGISLAAISDGLSNTILFVETDAEMAQPWSKPADVQFDPENPMNGLGNLRPGGFNAVFCDGSTQFISNAINNKMLEFMALRADGNPVDF